MINSSLINNEKNLTFTSINPNYAEGHDVY